MSDPFIGEIKMFGGNFAPRGYSSCSGQLLSIAQNSALFSILGTTFGGDGQNTFGLPDLRGRAPIHYGAGPGLTPIELGEVAGTEMVTLLNTQMPAHVHTMMGSTDEATSNVPTPNCFLGSAVDKDLNPVNIYTSTQGTPTPFNPQSGGIAGGSQAFPIRNPYLAVNFIIALEGIYPSRP